jgi:hypothetical protein
MPTPVINGGIGDGWGRLPSFAVYPQIRAIVAGHVKGVVARRWQVDSAAQAYRKSIGGSRRASSWRHNAALGAPGAGAGKIYLRVDARKARRIGVEKCWRFIEILGIVFRIKPRLRWIAARVYRAAVGELRQGLLVRDQAT